MNQESLNQLIIDSDFSQSVPTTTILGVTVSTEALLVTLTTDVIFAVLWYVLGLFNITSYSYIFFILYILLDVYNILNDSTNTDVSVAEAYNDIQSEVIRIEGMVGVVIIAYAVASLATDMEPQRREVALRLFTYSLIVICLSIVTYSTPNSSQHLRNLRILKERLSNQGIFLFILGLVVLLIGV